jgi:hypothetical protein
MTDTDDDPIWSRLFARRIAKLLGYTGEPVNATAEQLLGEITDDFRHLWAARKIAWVGDLAETLAQRRPTAAAAEVQEPWLLDQLREVREYTAYLRGRYGAPVPADEKDYWTDEDLHEWTADSLRRRDAEDPWPENLPVTEPADAQAR